MWKIIQLSHHDKLSDTTSTQLQHNFNTTSTQLQHSFHTSFNNLWNNSSTHFHHILSRFFTTILPQQTIQDLVTKLSFTIYDAILYHILYHNFITYLSIDYETILHHNFITYFINKLSHNPFTTTLFKCRE